MTLYEKKRIKHTTVTITQHLVVKKQTIVTWHLEVGFSWF